MERNLQSYDPQREFAVERVYQKLTRGIDQLTAEEAVDGLLNGANLLRQGINQVVERIFEGAEEKQQVVVEDRTEMWKRSTEKVQDAISQVNGGDYDTVEKRLRDATKASIAARESVSKMKYIKQRGCTEYNPAQEAKNYVRELEDFVQKGYNGVKLLETEVL